MNYVCLIGGIVAIILAIQLGRIQTVLHHIEKHLDDIATHTSKEYRH